MAKVIILSNRIVGPAGSTKVSGATNLLQPAYAETGDLCLAWNGQRVEDTQACEFKAYSQDSIDYLLCPLSQYQFQHYYAGYAHQSLWPALHRRTDLIVNDAEHYRSYQQLNAKFAQKIAQVIKAEDWIWVHDYHFFSVARYCRARGLTNRIGFFLHTPFADLSAWQALPHGQALIQDLCHYDVVGLQTQQDQQHCLRVMQHMLPTAQIEMQTETEMPHFKLHLNSHTTQFKSYPMGVALKPIQQLAKSYRIAAHAGSYAITTAIPAYAAAFQRIFEFDQAPRQRNILSVDHIDYAAGLFERLDAIEYFFAHAPATSTAVSFLQLARPCRLDLPLYQALFQQFRLRVSQLNQRYRPHACLAIQLSHHQLPEMQLIQTLARTDICWISCLAAGMQTIAKAYIAAQDPNNPGVLILSKYAGAAEQMTAALIVDPHDPQAMAMALHTALNMPKTERIQRYRELFKVIHAFNIKDWRHACLQDLKQRTYIKAKLLENLKPTSARVGRW